jgi:hypothetical protein
MAIFSPFLAVNPSVIADSVCPVVTLDSVEPGYRRRV